MGIALAFVAGATGYTGCALVAALRAQGIPTIAHVRPGSSASEVWRERFGALGAEVDHTPWEAEAMRALIATRRPSHCFALLGTTRSRAQREGLRDAYERIDYGLTRLLLDAARAAAYGPRFVYLSAMGATARTRNPYVAVRGRLERELGESGLPHVIVRPAFITGPDREESRPAERMAAMAVDGLLGAFALVGLRGPRDRYGSLTGRELAEGMVAVAARADQQRVIVDVAGIRRAREAMA